MANIKMGLNRGIKCSFKTFMFCREVVFNSAFYEMCRRDTCVLILRYCNHPILLFLFVMFLLIGVNDVSANNRTLMASDEIWRITNYEYTEKNQVNKYEYDDARRVKKTTDPGSFITSMNSDVHDNIAQVTDAEGQLYLFVYDYNDRLKKITRQDNGQRVKEYDYDLTGNVIEMNDYDGTTTTYSYDVLNRLTGINYPDGTSEAFTYDAFFGTDRNGEQKTESIQSESRCKNSMAFRYAGAVSGCAQCE